MSNVYSIINGQQITQDNRITSSSFRKSTRSDEFTVENVRKIAATYAPVTASTPAWITSKPELNRTVATLRKRGWRVECYANPKSIICFHPNLDSKDGVHILDAMKIQVILDKAMGRTA